MPFTISHAVVALPFRRTPLPVAAVAVGSMSPDAVLFLPVLPPYAFAHSAVGIVTVDLAVSLVALVAWWWLVRPAWASALRGRLPAEWSQPERLPPRRVLAVLAAVLLGAVSHVAWDSGTHRSGWLVERVAALRGEVGGHPVYSLLQDGSSALGLALLVVLGVRWWRRNARAAGAARPPLPGAIRFVVGVPVVVGGAVVTGRMLLAVLAGGGVAGAVVTAAFAVPQVLAVGLVAGAVALAVTVGGRGDAAAPSGPSGPPVAPDTSVLPAASDSSVPPAVSDASVPPAASDPDGQERREVGP